MAKQPFNPEGLVVKIGLGLVLIFLITSIINFSAINKEDEECMAKIYDLMNRTTENRCGRLTTQSECQADYGCMWEVPTIFRANVDYGKLVPQTWMWIIVTIAGILAWRFSRGEGRWDRKRMVSVVLTIVVLYILYTKVLQPMMPDTLPSLEFAAYQLRTISPPGLQSLFG